MKKERLKAGKSLLSEQTGGETEPTSFMHVVEAKNHFMKTEIDKKIGQMMQWENVIALIQTNTFDRLQCTPQFVNFVNENHHEILKLPSKVAKLYFATDSLKSSVQEYVKAINSEQMTLEMYKESAYSMLMEISTFRKFLTKIKNIPNIRFVEPTCYDDAFQLMEEVKTFMTRSNASNTVKRAFKMDMKSFKKEANFYIDFLKPYDEAMMKWAAGKLQIVYKGALVPMYAANSLPSKTEPTNSYEAYKG
jgi:hypothetical protein